MSTPRRVLVVGKESKLGAALIAQLDARGDQVIATTRRRGNHGPYLDLADSPSAWPLPPDLAIAYICAGVTSLRACESQPAETARVNVHGPAELCRKLARSGVFPVIFSTNLVFDGERPLARTDAALRPQCEYGRQKAALECALRQDGSASGIVRLTKVLDPTHALFSRWTAELLRGRPIEAFTDMTMAPITLDHAVAAIIAWGDRQHSGIAHISARADISYYHAARHLAASLHVDLDLVNPARAALHPQVPAVSIPQYTSLAAADAAGSPQPDPLTAVEAFASLHKSADNSHSTSPCLHH